MKLPLTAALTTLVLVLAQDGVTYDDTPFLPDSEYRVHGRRPWPSKVRPGAECGAPPSDAVVLFGGESLAKWKTHDGDAGWLVENGYAEVNGTGSITTREEFGDIQLHLEFASPEVVFGESQGRGNSGVFLMGRYEVQILDSWENRTYPDGQAAALYGQEPPEFNVARGPGEWQTYDIFFEAPRFEERVVTRPARVTVVHNGVVVHHAREFIGATTHRKVATYSAHPPKGPIQLQDHGNPVRFRNIWVRKLTSMR